MKDSAEQKIQLGDLIVFRIGYDLVLGRVLKIFDPSNMLVSYVQPKRDKRDKNDIKSLKYYTSTISPGNSFIIEREFIQPELKEKLSRWNGKNQSLRKALGMSTYDIVMWSMTRSTSIERII